MIVGTVEEQFLERGRYSEGAREIVLLVSVVVEEKTGSKVRLVEPAGFIVDGAGTYLGYIDEPPLAHGTRYAVFAAPNSDSEDTFELLLGQVYAVSADGILTPLMPHPANRDLEGSSLTAAEAAWQ
jgi:hypothetical protein